MIAPNPCVFAHETIAVTDCGVWYEYTVLPLMQYAA
jgi:hypothetical protein